MPILPLGFSNAYLTLCVHSRTTYGELVKWFLRLIWGIWVELSMMSPFIQ